MGPDPRLSRGLRGGLLHPAAPPLRGQGRRGCPGASAPSASSRGTCRDRRSQAGVMDRVWWLGLRRLALPAWSSDGRACRGGGVLARAGRRPSCRGPGGAGTAVRGAPGSAPGPRVPLGVPRLQVATPWAGGGGLPTPPCRTSPLGVSRTPHVPHRMCKAQCDFGVFWNLKILDAITLTHSSMFLGARPGPGPGRGWVPVCPLSL